MANEQRLIPLQKRIIYAGDVFNSLMAEKGWSATEAADFIKEFWTVDAAEVVRCKDCKKVNVGGLSLHCSLTGMPMDEDDFCSYGERKDNG